MSVAGIDFNHDGKKDLIVGNDEEYQPNHWGAIYVYWGGEQISNVPNKMLVSQFGEGVGNGLLGCDLNGDGYEDVASCCPGWNWGKTFIWLGGQYADTLYDCYIERSGYQNRFGASQISCDVNGDGVDDLIIGEPGYYFHQGRIHVVLGDTSLHQSVGVKPENPLIPTNPQLSLRGYPNPFNNSITFKAEWAGNDIPVLEIINLKGEQIKKMFFQRNQNMIEWDGSNSQGNECNSGIYLAKLSTKNQSTYTKIALIK
ncbi:MAG: FG-GAP-like repeat-containing protein [bacterium]|nr:FG-GAP-like repeat-containing protein [bacterium]